MFFKKRLPKPPKPEPMGNYVCAVCGGEYYGGQRPPVKIKDGYMCLNCNRDCGMENQLPAKVATMTSSQLRAVRRPHYTIYAQCASGLPVNPHRKIKVEVNEKQIVFDLDTGTQATIPLNRVLYVHADTHTVTSEQDAKTNPALRALVGGALLGDIGAIAGAASGLKKKEKISTRIETLEIAYRSKEGKTKTIQFVYIWDSNDPTGWFDPKLEQGFRFRSDFDFFVTRYETYTDKYAQPNKPPKRIEL